MDRQLPKSKSAFKIASAGDLTDEVFEQVSKELLALESHYDEIMKESESMKVFQEEMDAKLVEFLKELDDAISILAEEEVTLIQDISDPREG